MGHTPGKDNLRCGYSHFSVAFLAVSLCSEEEGEVFWIKEDFITPGKLGSENESVQQLKYGRGSGGGNKSSANWRNSGEG